MGITTPYSNLYSRWYDYFISPAVVDTFFTAMERLLGHAQAGSRILSVGCGGGQTEIEMVNRRSDIHVTGLDLSETLVLSAKKRAKTLLEAGRINFVQGDALDLPFDDDSFEHVFSAGSIKHWPDRVRGLQECVRVLKPGGILVVMEADRSCHFDDVGNWLARTRVPPPLRPALRLYFRTYVAGRSLAPDDAVGLLEGLPIEKIEGPARIPGRPAWVFSAVKSAKSAKA
jgi:ubiquinone/menaquinone biosynthesis C-methylase UbiE